MPTHIPPIHRYTFTGTGLQYRHFNPIFLVLACFVAVCAFLVPYDATPYSPDTQHVTTTVSLPAQQINVAWYIKQTNDALTIEEASKFAGYAIEYTKQFRLDLSVFLALMKIESGYKPEAVSKAGALGLTQVIPRWHEDRIAQARKAVDAYSIFEPRLNMYVGASALRAFLDSAKNLDHALALYNGSAHHPDPWYARLVMAEAYNVRTKVLNPPKSKL